MHQNIKNNIIPYQNKKHHREWTRENIDQSIISTIQSSQNPSLRYKNAFKSVYLDQLDKNLIYRQQRKKQNSKGYSLHSNGIQTSSIPLSPITPIRTYNQNNTKSLDITFRDFDRQTLFKKDKIIRQYEKQQTCFFRSQDQYQRKLLKAKQQTKNSIKYQLEQKENMKFLQKQKKYQQYIQLKQHTEKLNQKGLKQKINKKNQNSRLRDQLQYQMQMKKLQKNHKKSISYVNLQKHNPITNPIEYHIDNPYILQKYQQKLNH